MRLADTRRRFRQLWPFAAMAVFGLALVGVPGAALGLTEFLAAAALATAVGCVALLVPWHRLPADATLVPATVYLVSVGLLRDAAGGAVAGVGALALIPLIWFALYGQRRQLVAVIVGLAVLWVVPFVAIGGPRYPVTGWRGPVLMVVLAAAIGLTVQRLVNRIGTQAAALRDRDRERDALLAQVRALAATDDLTGLPNRRSWNERLSSALKAGGPELICVAVVDLDDFKALNDGQGHHVGDAVLGANARAWQAELRPNDLLARIGGDEFGLLLPACDLAGAEQVVERLRCATTGGVTCSAGLAQWDGGETPEELQGRADAMLYQAKAAGRDKSAGGRLRAV